MLESSETFVDLTRNNSSRCTPLDHTMPAYISAWPDWKMYS